MILYKESFVWVQQDAYVLCRVFHKNNIGPPSGNRYAPFLEEEWADEGVALIPGVDVRVRAEPLPVANGNNQMDQVCTSLITHKLLSLKRSVLKQSLKWLFKTFVCALLGSYNFVICLRKFSQQARTSLTSTSHQERLPQWISKLIIRIIMRMPLSRRRITTITIMMKLRKHSNLSKRKKMSVLLLHVFSTKKLHCLSFNTNEDAKTNQTTTQAGPHRITVRPQ